jgi:AcrR family transcriptional regulator
MRPGIDKGAGRAWHIGVRATKVPEGGAKKKLLDAAETLVAAKGFDSVSVRDVTGAAGANVAAVNYHFGSREGLMDMVIARILDPLCGERAKALETSGKSAPALVRAYVAALLPVAQSTGMDGKIFPRLAGRILALPDEALPPVLAAARREVGNLYMEALARMAKANAPDWAFFEAGIAQSLIAVEDSGRMAVLLEDWIAFGVRGFDAGASPKKKKDDPQGMLFDL